MKKAIYLIFILFLGFSCTEDFEELNTNPNNPVNASGALLLPTVILDLSNRMVNQTNDFGEVTAQYSARYQFNDIDFYRWQPDNRFWSPMYSILQDLNDIESIESANGNYTAVAKILKAYIFSIITDAYGDVPMSEANKAKEGIIAPAYDSQEAIYNALFDLLKEANESIDTSGKITGDLLYGGDMMKWKKFGNSLRLRLLLRVSNVKDVSAEMTEIVSDPTTFPIFESNADNAIYNYSGNLPDIAGVSAPGGGREFEYFLNIPSTHLINTLNQNNDPRLNLWLSPRDCDPTDPDCVQDRLQGLAPGQAIGEIGVPKDYSRRSVEFFESATLIQGIFMTHSELNFILAEARERGLISTGSAEEFYNRGVTSSFDQWGVTLPDDFLTATIPYDNTTERLYEQKWLALYHTGIEAWLDWKRTSKPDFIQAGPGTINNNRVPVRLQYPALEQSINTENYNSASSTMGGDDINASSWWW